MGDRTNGEDLADRRARVERGEGILEDHLDLVAAAAGTRLRKAGRCRAFEQDLRRRRCPCSLIRSRPERRFAGAAFADNAQRPPGARSNETSLTAGTIALRAEKRAAAPIGLHQTLDLQDRRLRRLPRDAVLAGQMRNGRDQAARIGMTRATSAPASALPCSTKWPFSITTTLSAISATTPKSWVMNITLIPLRR